jgi:hypothetical protein
VHIGLVKDEVFCGIYSDILVIKLVVLIDIFCPDIRVCDDDPVLELRAQIVDKVKLLGVDAARDLCAGKGLFQVLVYLIKFL